jgi:cell fate (sporulation/competence/biofilm development) regulator YlbF (YheA/YmcA/DUF963 family)
MSNTQRYEDIITKTDELAIAIKSHDISVRYADLLGKLKKDEKAQDIYTRLVKLGKDISEAKDTGKELSEEFVLENDALKNDLQDSPLVREFVEAQKDYFEMISAVQKMLINFNV